MTNQDFATQYASLQTEEEREAFARQQVGFFEQNYLAPEAHALTVDMGRQVGVDFTEYLTEYQGAQLAPFSPETIQERLPEEAKKLPLWKRAMSRTLKTVDWWVENINKPTAAIGLAIGSGLVPGTQSFEKEFEIARKQIAKENGTHVRNLSIMESYEALKRSYEQADTFWGVKGAAEILFDPLNLVGFGLPGKLATISPRALRPLLLKANAIDQLPGVVTAKGLGRVAWGAKQIPVLNELFKPHATSLVRETADRTRQAIANGFGENFFSGNPEDTIALIANRQAEDMQGAGPFSVGNILQHIQDDFVTRAKTPEAGMDEWVKFVDDMEKMNPEQFSEFIGGYVGELEGQAIKAGGQRISLDPFTDAAGDIVKGISTRRVERVTSMLQRLKFDQQYANNVAKVFDNSLSKTSEIYMKKIEPLLVRPLSLSHLAFGMFGPMNVVEDGGFSIIGMGSAKLRMNDDLFRHMTFGLEGAASPQTLLEGKFGREAMTRTGMYDEFKATGFTGKVQEAVEKMHKAFGTERATKLGFGIRRATWFDEYSKTFYKLMRERGADDTLIDEFANILKGELPPGLDKHAQDIQAAAWIAYTTGDPQRVEDLVSVLSPQHFNQKAQNAILEEAVELPPDARHVLRKAIFDENISEESFDQIYDEALEEILKWNRFQPDAVQARYGEMFDALGKRAPRSPQEAKDMLDLFHGATDQFHNLQREMAAHFTVSRRRASDAVKEQLDESYEKMMADVYPELERQMEAASKRVAEHAKGVFTKEEAAAIGQKTTRPVEGLRKTEQVVFRGGGEQGMVARGEIAAEDLQLGPGRYFSPDKTEAATFGEVQEQVLNLEPDWTLDFDKAIGSNAELDQKMNFVGSGVFLNTEQFDDYGEMYFSLQQQFRQFIDNPAQADKELNEELKKAGIQILKSSDPMEEFNVIGDFALRDVPIQQPTTGVRAESLTKEVDKLVEADTLLLKRNIETRQLEQDLRKEMFGKYPTPQARSAYPGDFWEDFYRQKEEIWNIYELERGALNAQRNDSWVALNSRIIPDNPAHRQAAIKGHQNKLEEIENQLQLMDDILEEMPETSLRGHSAHSVNATADALSAQHKLVSRRLAELKKNVRFRTVPEIQVKRKQLARHKMAVKEATDAGASRLEVESLEAEVIQAERALVKEFSRFVPADRKAPFELLDQRIEELAQQIRKAEVPELKARLQGQLDSLLDQQRRIMGALETEEGVRRFASTSGVNQGAIDRGVNAVVQAMEERSLNTANLTVEDIVEVLDEQNLGNFIEEGFKFSNNWRDLRALDLVQDIYSRVVNTQRKDFLPLDEAQVIDRVLKGSVEQYQSRSVTSLVEKGLARVARRNPDGSISLALTEEGIRRYKQVPFTGLEEIARPSIPPALKGFKSTIQSQAELLEGTLNAMIQEQRALPAMTENMAGLGEYFKKAAKVMRDNPDQMAVVKEVKQQAGIEANKKMNRFFINYDNRSTGDYFMQRLMPFWMYESRRWPRLVNLAGTRPAMAKFMVNSTADWDYGYSSAGAGFEFNPMKGTILGGMRRLGARDFPEYHGGFRGKIEEGTDWLGRFGFYFNPAITGGIDIMQGETGNIVPPPLALMTHGAAAAGVNIPGLHDFTLNSRYMDFLTDQVLADNYLGPDKEFQSAPQLKVAMENDNDRAHAIYWAAQRQAAGRMVALQQGAILRYRPQAKTEFIKTQEDAVEQILGIDAQTQQEMKRLGVPLYSTLAVSGSQRRAMKEVMEGAGVNYDAWVSSTHAFRPLEEQKALMRIDEFWRERDRIRNSFTLRFNQLSDQWTQGTLSGPQARQQWQELQGQQAASFDALKNLDRFADVPITNAERDAFREKFGGNPPLTHPVDEVLEKYYSVSPEDPTFIDQNTGEVNWQLFFDTRDQILDGFRDEPYFELVQKELNTADTALGRSLEQGKPFFNEYFGVRDDVLKQLMQSNPQLGSASQAYRKAIILGQRTFDPQAKAQYKKQAADVIVANPMLLLMENMIRQRREQLRRESPEMEQWYQLFIAQPQTQPQTTSKVFGDLGF